MQFRRVDALPPYVFAHISTLTAELRHQGEDVIDLGFGNPDLPSPDLAVEKLIEAAQRPRNHRYSSSRGIPNLRRAAADLYRRRFGVELDPDREVLNTIGAKEGLSHLMWVLLQPGDSALVPSPSYPIHLYAPIFAGASVTQVAMGPDEDLFGNLEDAYARARPRPRVVILSFPHNPTTATVERDFMERVVAFAKERELLVVHDFAYADIAFDGHEPPSILQVAGAKDCCVELYTLTKSFSMAGWRVGFLVGNADVDRRARAAEVVPRLRDVPADPDRGDRDDERAAGASRRGLPDLRSRGATRSATGSPAQAGRFRSRGGRCSSGRRFLRRTAGSARSASPRSSRAMPRSPSARAVGFGPDGDGHVRFALVENEQRIRQAVRSLRRFLG